MPETIEISEQDLYRLFHKWETDHRAGKCISLVESLQKPIGTVAKDAAKHAFKELSINAAE
jgi:hypothetical protein